MAHTDWNSSHRDKTNQLTISNGSLVTAFPQEWHNEVINGVSSPGRVGDYTAIEVISGEPISGAAACVWGHALWGDQDSQLWNTTGDDPDEHGPGACRLSFTGAADLALNPLPFHSWTAVDDPDPLFFGDEARAVVRLTARELYVRPVRDNTGPVGFVNFTFDPVADGVPEEFADDAEVEWESDYVDLVKVELTGDGEVRESDGGEGITVALRDHVQPAKSAGTWSTWQKGVPGEWNDTRDGRIEFNYAGEEEVTWTEVTGLIAGDTGWDDIQTDPDGQPDEVIIFGTQSGMDVGTPVLETSYSPAYDIAVRITVRSPRYRWVWEGGTMPPRRFRGRPDALAGGAGRFAPMPKSVQQGRRFAGAVI